ncbi:hypothetical protein TrST_g12433 [Triparma strigata]|uniref:J domain-containing protein n=1 Tax=Triparma strigata TaxID=1606541 RepID=A0A9W7E9S9_9STRA|nr:hypothetical protein TrST_g12433 [Triparma strigata]
MGLKELLEAAEMPLDLYEALGIKKTATESEIKKAYHKLALKHHPDKSSSPMSTKIFQALSSAYDVLKTPEKRERYDQVGLDDDDSDLGMEEPDCGWTEYFRAIFKRVDEGEIETFKDKYQRSEEERLDILKYYRVCKGDFSQMLECIMLSKKEDFGYWKGVVEEALEKGEIEEQFEIKGFNGEAMDMGEEVGEDLENEEVQGNSRKEEKKASGKKVAKKKKKSSSGGGGMEDLINSIKSKKTVTPKSELAAMINSKRKNPMEDMIAQMEAKYGGGDKKKKKRQKKKPSHEDIDDDEFERIQKSMGLRK